MKDELAGRLQKAGAGGSAIQWKWRKFGTARTIEQVELRLTMIGFQRKGALFFLSLSIKPLRREHYIMNIQFAASISDEKVRVDGLIVNDDGIYIKNQSGGVLCFSSLGEKLWENSEKQSVYCFCPGTRGILSGWKVMSFSSGEVKLDLPNYYGSDIKVLDECEYVGEFSENVNCFATASYFYRGVNIEFPEKGALRISQNDYFIDQVNIPFSFGRQVRKDDFVVVDLKNISLYLAGETCCRWAVNWQELLGGGNRISDLGACSRFVSVVSTQGKLKILSVESGNELASVELNLQRTKIKALENKLLITGVSGITNHCVCFDLENMRVSWKRDNVGGPFDVQKDIVFTVEGSMQPVGLDLETGNEVWKSKKKISTNYIRSSSKYVVYCYKLLSLQIYNIQSL